MPRYDEVYARLADRAVRQGVVDFESFVEQMASQGVPIDRIEDLLLQDLENNGPIFGKFVRSLVGASESAVMAAERQGDIAGTALAKQFLDRQRLGLALDAADPEALEAIEAELADRIPYTWVATLEKTCHRCLPLHGKTQLMGEWLAQGLHPDSIHQGWTSSCHCSLVPADEAGKHKDLINPLVRTKVIDAKGVKRTQRAVTQLDVEKAQRAVAEALASDIGRAVLRQMGAVNG